jgi:hypothetical protein
VESAHITILNDARAILEHTYRFSMKDKPRPAQKRFEAFMKRTEQILQSDHNGEAKVARLRELGFEDIGN